MRAAPAKAQIATDKPHPIAPLRLCAFALIFPIRQFLIFRD